MIARGVTISTPKAMNAAMTGAHDAFDRAVRLARASLATRVRKPTPPRMPIIDTLLLI